MTNFILFIIIVNFIVVIYNLYMWFKVGIENDSLKKENKELKSENKRLLEENQIGHDYADNILREIIIDKNKKINNLEHKINMKNNDIEDNYRKLLLEKFNELREYYEDEYSKKELGTAERVRFVGIVYGIYEAISLIEQNK